MAKQQHIVLSKRLASQMDHGEVDIKPGKDEHLMVPAPGVLRLDRCAARVWAGGRGAQCRNRIAHNSDSFCGMHMRQAEGSASGEPSHGRFDGEIPESKLLEFSRCFQVDQPRDSYKGDLRSQSRRSFVQMERSISPIKLRRRRVDDSGGFRLCEEQPMSSQTGQTADTPLRKSARISAKTRQQNTSGDFADSSESQDIIQNHVTVGSDSDATSAEEANLLSTKLREQDQEDAESCDAGTKTPARCRWLLIRGCSYISDDSLQQAQDDAQSSEAPMPQDVRRSWHPSNINECLCRARVWASGRGAQCSRAPIEDALFCKQHLQNAVSRKGLPHGRIDGEVPIEKLSGFLQCEEEQTSSSTKRCTKSRHGSRLCKRRRSSGSSCDDADMDANNYITQLMPLPSALAQRRTVASFTGPKTRQQCTRQGSNCIFTRLHEEACVHILECLQQAEVFRAASTCRPLVQAAEEPRLFQRLDLRRVGCYVGGTGRRRVLINEAVIASLVGFLSQPRFSKAEELDFSGLDLGAWPPRSHPLLRFAAKRCPQVSLLRLNCVKPRDVWSDLKPHPPVSFIRCVRELWPERPISLEIDGRQIAIHA